MREQTWTIDSIAHALPHPVTRQKFLAEVNLAPVDQLPTVVDKWVRFVEQWEAGRDHVERLRDHFKEHGHLPATYEATLVDVTDQILEDAERIRRGAA
ncbi:hypothetical protein AB0L04_00655 [Streptomyces glaucescens]|uniref:hypothetical protein n=1 Tax=Streptomyces glaucescens TaxID=1907 RepID=UPI00344C03B7